MCGIAGFVLTADDEQTAARLRARLARRGPDGSWFARCEPYGLVQTRLAVIDLSERVRYPLRNEGGDLRLLFNGEIYAHEEHRRELERRGHRFATDCDAEVVIHGYEEWGEGVFARLDGMFALAIYDHQSRALLLARDALGIKPLVYTNRGAFAFSSDALSLVAAGLTPGAIDESDLGTFLRFQYVLPPRTGLEGVEQVEPGGLLRRSAAGRVTLARWRPMPFAVREPQAQIDVSATADALDRSVARQLVADVPVGVFLSSGLDSALVLDSAVRQGSHPIAFTLGFHGHGDYDELPAAARLAADLGVEHVTCTLRGGFLDHVRRVTDAFDQPFADASAIAMAELAAVSSQRVTVALSGTGGDDLFAGYNRHRLHLIGGLLNRLPRVVRATLSRVAVPSGAERRNLLSTLRTYAARMARLEGADPLAQYAQLIGVGTSPAVSPLLLFDAPDHSAALLARLHLPADTTLRQIQALELQTYLPGDLLPKEDRTSMAVGLETRVPLLGSELLHLAQRIPDAQKVSMRTGKRVLRSLARERLPRYLTRARKRGFAVPLADLFAGPWRTEAIEWFSCADSDLIDGPGVARGLCDGTLPANDAWTLASLIGWEQSVRDARALFGSASKAS
jgi:asparagine synthase (glutamine-hydrolysing)